ncbi:MAG: hypothetical protein L0Y70_23455, partial [Gemmataceae bacterium]|nr:hypothetical protein [Gemmataceae bacterium]
MKQIDFRSASITLEINACPRRGDGYAVSGLSVVIMSQPSPLFSLPETRQERWLLLSQLIAEWYRPLTRGDGYSDDELQQCRTRLGTPVPTAMREWYGLAGRRDDVWNQQDTLLSPARVFCEAGV